MLTLGAANCTTRRAARTTATDTAPTAAVGVRLKALSRIFL